MTEIKFLYLIDPVIKGFDGHYFNYANSIFKVLNKRGIEFKLFADEKCDSRIKESMPFCSVFHKKSLPHVFFIHSAILDLLYHWLRRIKEWRNVCNIITQPNGLVFIDNCFAIELLCLSIGILLSQKRRLKTFIIMLRVSYYNTRLNRWKDGAYKQKLALIVLNLLSKFNRIIFVSDSEILASRYSQFIKNPIYIVPIPHTLSSICQNVVQNRPTIRFSNLGFGSYFKGITYLVKAIQELHHSGLIKNVKFTIQCYQGINHDQKIDTAICDLKKLNCNAIKIIEQPLNEEEYIKEFDEADVLLFPYLADRGECTSGPFAEALAAGKPVIVTRGTWLSNQLEKFNSGGVICKSEDSRDLALSITKVKDGFIEHKSKSENAKIFWNKIHNADNFLKTIESIVISD